MRCPAPRDRHHALTGQNFFEETGNNLSWQRDPRHAAAQSTPSYTGPFITVAVLFFIFGFITNLNMALVPHLRSIFDLPYAWAMLAESAFFLAYFVFSSPTSKLIEIHRLQEDDGGLAVHPGGGLPAVSCPPRRWSASRCS